MNCERNKYYLVNIRAHDDTYLVFAKKGKLKFPFKVIKNITSKSGSQPYEAFGFKAIASIKPAPLLLVALFS